MTDTTAHTVESLRTLVAQGRTAEAVELLTRIAWGEAEPDGNPLEWAGLAEEIGLFDLAGSILRKAHARTPDSPDLLSRLAEHCLEQGDPAAAVPLLRSLLNRRQLTPADFGPPEEEPEPEDLALGSCLSPDPTSPRLRRASPGPRTLDPASKGIHLKGTGRKVFLSAFYGRLRETAYHPASDSTLTYRQIVMHQVYRFARVLKGEESAYEAFAPK